MSISDKDLLLSKKDDSPETESKTSETTTPTVDAPKALGPKPGYKSGDLDKESEPVQTPAKVIAPVNVDIKPDVSNPKLSRMVEDLYKGQKMKKIIGNGTTMAAIREEKRTRKPVGGVFHTTKGTEYKQGLQNLLDGRTLDELDTSVVNALISDLEDALK